MNRVYGYLAVAGWVWVVVLAVILYRQLRRKPLAGGTGFQPVSSRSTGGSPVSSQHGQDAHATLEHEQQP